MLKVSVSGVRGIWGKDLTHEVVINYTKAFISFLGENKNIAIGCDTRKTGDPFKLLVISILTSFGYNVTDLDECATPLVLFAVRNMGLDGGIVLSASHNPVMWNAFKFVKAGGLFFNAKDMEKIEKAYNNTHALSYNYMNIGHHSHYNHLLPAYLEVVKESFDVKAIRERKFKVVADAVNGTACHFLPSLFKMLELDGTIIFKDPSGEFERPAEPKPENLSELEAKVLEKDADLGLAFDPDGDRLSLVDEKGRAIGENWTLILAYLCYLETEKGENENIAINLSTSMLISEIAAKNNAKVYKTAVGEINVTEEMKKQELEIGGEGNGGVIFPKINFCRDSIVATFFILEYLAKGKKTLSQIIESFVNPYSINTSLKLTHLIQPGILQRYLSNVLQKFQYKKAVFDTRDGVRADYSSGWLQVRPSNTEPILRIMGESYSKENQEAMVEELVKLFTDPTDLPASD